MHDLTLNPGFHSRFCHTALKKSQNRIWNEKREFEASKLAINPNPH